MCSLVPRLLPSGLLGVLLTELAGTGRDHRVQATIAALITRLLRGRAGVQVAAALSTLASAVLRRLATSCGRPAAVGTLLMIAD